MAYALNAELAAIVYLKTVAGLPTASIATTLPADNSAWSASGFVTVVATDGRPLPYSHARRDRLLVSCWAASPNSQRPPWQKAHALAAAIVDDTLPNAWQPLHLTPPAPYTSYRDLYLHHARVAAGPFRTLGDFGNHARVDLRLELDWHQAET